ncbi:MAG TPA: c(7)-type cytochrome triheme domain-containing protein [Gammaproteobacteria bacterium]
MKQNKLRTLLAALMMLLALPLLTSHEARAEYGDVVLNNYAEAAGMRPAVFPHWFHRVRFRCKVCHADLGFKMQAGANEINMAKIIEGQYCGACHNGEVAWSIENCDLCHSGKPGTPTQVHGNTVQNLLGGAKPAATPAPAAAQAATTDKAKK